MTQTAQPRAINTQAEGSGAELVLGDFKELSWNWRLSMEKLNVLAGSELGW